MPNGSPQPPLARTGAEARLYLDLRPCECGETAFEPATAIVELDNGELGSRYEGTCPACGTSREFLFRLPPQVLLPTPGQVVYGDGSPSELLDPGEWLWVADQYAATVPADISGLDADARRVVRARLSTAVAAMDEVFAFLPADADAVPSETIHTELGRALYLDAPDRFDRDRLEIVRSTYRQLLDAAD